MSSGAAGASPKDIAAALPGYEIGGVLGRGGWGVVFAGRHRELGREVAIKQLPAALSAAPGVRDRFRSEARLLASLDQPHVVPVYDYVVKDDLSLLVMEKLQGGTLWQRFTSQGVSHEEACAIVLAVCSGLHFAHGKGILHRDVKPENIMFSGTGVVKIADFGIAKVVGGDDVMATQAGEIIGTPAYMAPEQATASDLGPHTDVYALGCVLFELLAGRLPFADTGDSLATLFLHVYEDAPYLGTVAPTVPAGIAEVVSRALARPVEDRWPTAEAFGVALGEAATADWGIGWPAARANISVMGAGSILAATERPTVGGTGAASTAAPRLVVRAGVPAVATEPMQERGAVAAPPAPPVPVAARRAPIDLERDKIVPVQKIASPRWPLGPLVAAAGMVVVMVLVAFAGIGARSDAPSAGGWRIGNVAVDAGTKAVPVDLGADLDVVPPNAPPGSSVSARYRAGGVTLASLSADVVDGKATFEAGTARYFAPGSVTAEYDVADADGRVVDSLVTPVDTAQNPLVSVPFGAAALVGLFLLAYAESRAAALRLGHRKISAPILLVLLGGMLGADVSVLAWVLGRPQPRMPGVVAAAAAGMVAGAAVALAAHRLGRRQRFRQATVRVRTAKAAAA